MQIQKHYVLTHAKRFKDSTSASVSILFGLMAIVMLMVIGASIDLARWLNARSATIAAVDAAVLAGARDLQVNGLDADAAREIAQRYYEANVSQRIPLSEDSIRFVVTDQGTALTADGTAKLETTFLKLAGINGLDLLKLSGAERSKAVLAVNGNAEFSLEIALMLDVTGSMCNSGVYNCTSGDKLDAMKEAAKDLVNIVVWDDQGSQTSRVALVPFSSSINIGSLDAGIIHPGAATKRMKNGYGWNMWWRRAGSCASERTGAQAYTDVAPTGGNRLGQVYTLNGSCDPGSAVVPLSNDKAMLTSSIDALRGKGGTAGHLGTAWAWYMLSPNWNSVLPATSQPDTYAKLSQLNSRGRPVLEKIAVLMTDGEYNVQYCSTGQFDKESAGSSYYQGNCSSDNGKSAEQARLLCQGMKDEGITVYTVGFQLEEGGEAATTMAQCATTPGHVYNADNAEQLKQSFRDIAVKISQLYLSK
ncbi:MAG: pilus assembly protein [Filomicrobium sp.]